MQDIEKDGAIVRKLGCMLLLSSLLGFFGEVSYAQGGGVSFDREDNWAQILQKAKAENKFVFVDCYATWCGPCKLMDSLVYSGRLAGAYMNDHFISVKVQIDTNKRDDTRTRDWYADARTIQEKFTVSEVPTYLFFSPDGQLVHRGLGAVRDTDFVKLAANAMDPNKQYYTMINRYLNGEKNYKVMPYLVNRSKAYHYDSLAVNLAQDYIENYLMVADEGELFRSESIQFICENTTSSLDGGFLFLFRNAERINKILGDKDYCERVVGAIIGKEEIDDLLWKNDKPAVEIPDWESLEKRVGRKYTDEYARRLVLDAQIRWYNEKDDYPQIIRYFSKKVRIYGLDTSGVNWATANNTIYQVFLMKCNDKAVLTEAAGWAKMLVDSHPADEALIDTYANLLYKIGDVKQAMKWEEKALAIAPLDKDIQNDYKRMETGQPTWQ